MLHFTVCGEYFIEELDMMSEYCMYVYIVVVDFTGR